MIKFKNTFGVIGHKDDVAQFKREAEKVGWTFQGHYQPSIYRDLVFQGYDDDSHDLAPNHFWNTYINEDDLKVFDLYRDKFEEVLAYASETV